ncbi:hypothetical protein RDWZM_006658 [Blomia tropicalis]|uniref:Uncharacterized protein n=1 Tax=Blomia tropicalis TaxID=40697 RepID=A0A9Q0M7G6_BLOTA|nr:hypothetical protein RDWZM_006658 [Blomia tropicalis]
MPNEPHEPQVIEVPSDDMPVVVHFKSQSSRVLVQQTHTPAVIGEPEHTSSEDEPQRVIHEVVKPVVQEIREVIQPYRRLIQQIQPVIEQTHTVIAKGEPRPSVEPLPISGATGGSSGSGSSGSSGGSFNGNGHGSFGSSGGSKYGGNGGGGGNNGNYAASASTVSLKSAPKNQETFRKNNNVQQYSQHQQQQQQQQPLRHQASASTNTNHQVSHHQPINNNGRKLSIQQIFQHAAANQGPQQGSSNSQYSSRRGDFRESSISPKAMSNRANFRTSLNNYAQMYQAPRLTPMQQYAYSDYKGAVSSLHEDDLPLMTFVAKPIRFRARARA